jgi:hypothetical protein
MMEGWKPQVRQGDGRFSDAALVVYDRDDH